MDAQLRKKFEEKATILKAIASPTRLYILELLSNGEQSVNELTDMIKFDMSTVSKHLSILRKAGVVDNDKRGSKVYYRLCYSCILKVIQDRYNIGPNCD